MTMIDGPDPMVALPNTPPRWWHMILGLLYGLTVSAAIIAIPVLVAIAIACANHNLNPICR